MRFTQQNILRDGMQTLGLNNEQFAFKFKIKPRALDTWLLPDEHPQFEVMDFKLQGQIFNALRERELLTAQYVDEATISWGVPIIHCDMFNFDFPTLYRITYKVEGVDLATGERDASNDSVECSYSLSDSPKGMASNMYVLKCEKIEKRNSKLDYGWLFITEHRSLERADAYLKAISEVYAFDDIYDLMRSYHFCGRIFTLHHVKKPAGKNVKDCYTRYISDNYLQQIKNEDFNFTRVQENQWEREFHANDLIQTPAFENMEHIQTVFQIPATYLH